MKPKVNAEVLPYRSHESDTRMIEFCSGGCFYRGRSDGVKDRSRGSVLGG